MIVEIYREPGDILGVGLSRWIDNVKLVAEGISILFSRCHDTQAIIIESMKQASLADRCGVLHVGDILLSVGGQQLPHISKVCARLRIRGLGFDHGF